MRYAILSDSHDNLDALQKALTEIQSRGITHGFHLGDFVAPFVIATMLEGNEIEWKCVWGNNDGDKALILQNTKTNPHIDFAPGEFRELTIEEKTIFLTHYPLLAENAAASGKYRAVFHGHTHKKRNEKIDGTLIANPGEIYGKRTGTPSFGIWDSEENTFEIVDLT